MREPRVSESLVENLQSVMFALVPPASVLQHRGADWTFWVCSSLLLLHVPALLVSGISATVYAHLPSVLFAYWVLCNLPARK